MNGLNTGMTVKIALELATNVLNCRRNPRTTILFDENGLECGRLKRDFLTLDLHAPFDQMLRVYDWEQLDLEFLVEMYNLRLIALNGRK